MSIGNANLVLVILIVASSTVMGVDVTDQLFQAVTSNDAENCLNAINNGASLDIRDDEGLTPLMVAAKLGSEKIVTILLEKGSDIDAVTEDSLMTPLHFAVEYGHLIVTKQLVELGADTSLENASGMTAYTLARANRNSELVAYFRDRQLSSRGIERNRRSTRRENEAVSNYRAMVDTVLADANSVSKTLAEFEDVVKEIDEIKKSGYSESRAWMSKRATSYKSVMLSLDRQIKAEGALVKKYATEEDAGEVVSLIDQTTKAWSDKFSYINDEMRRIRREQRREAMNQQRESRSKRQRDEEDNRVQDSEAEESPPQYDISNWLDTDMNGSQELCTSVHDEIMESYGQVLDLAMKANAQKTLVATQAIVLDRDQRFIGIMASFEPEEERKSRMERGIRRERGETRDNNSRGRRQEPRR